jgi:hypothetical protein
MPKSYAVGGKSKKRHQRTVEEPIPDFTKTGRSVKPLAKEDGRNRRKWGIHFISPATRGNTLPGSRFCRGKRACLFRVSRGRGTADRRGTRDLADCLASPGHYRRARRQKARVRLVGDRGVCACAGACRKRSCLERPRVARGGGRRGHTKMGVVGRAAPHCRHRSLHRARPKMARIGTC